MKKNNLGKRIKVIASLSAAVAGSSVMTASTLTATPVMAETNALAANITQDKAKTIAFNHAKATASQVTGYKIETDRERYGIFYEIEFKFNGYEFEYKINAANGAIVEWDKEPLEGYKKPTVTPTPVTKPVKPAVTAASYIGETKAKTIALTHAKLTANKISGYKIKLDNEKGVAYYDIDFRSGDYEYDYDINAKTGAVIRFEKELDIDPRYEGYVLNKDNKWYYAKNGRIDRSYTGLAYNKNNGGWFYAQNGLYNPSYTGIAKSTNGRLYFTRNGRWDTSYTGLAPYTDGKWYYVKNGRHEAYTGVCKSTNGKLYYAKNGVWDTSYTGLAQFHADGKWYYVKNGRHEAYTGVCKSTNGKLYYAKNGVWDTTFTGSAKNESGTVYNVKNGRV